MPSKSGSSKKRQPKTADFEPEVSSGFAIEENVPVPDSFNQRSKYPWKAMNVGASFFVKDGTKKSLTSVAHGAGKRLSMVFGVKEVTEKDKETGEDVKGVRVWRTK